MYQAIQFHENFPLSYIINLSHRPFCIATLLWFPHSPQNETAPARAGIDNRIISLSLTLLISRNQDIGLLKNCNVRTSSSLKVFQIPVMKADPKRLRYIPMRNPPDTIAGPDSSETVYQPDMYRPARSAYRRSPNFYKERRIIQPDNHKQNRERPHEAWRRLHQEKTNGYMGRLLRQP